MVWMKMGKLNISYQTLELWFAKCSIFVWLILRTYMIKCSHLFSGETVDCCHCCLFSLIMVLFKSMGTIHRIRRTKSDLRLYGFSFCFSVFLFFPEHGEYTNNTDNSPSRYCVSTGSIHLCALSADITLQSWSYVCALSRTFNFEMALFIYFLILFFRYQLHILLLKS